MSRELLLFAKAPKRGAVKTRLQGCLGSEGALQLHRELCEWSVRQLSEQEAFELVLCGSELNPWLQTLASQYAAACRWQCSGDLGARLSGAIRAALERAECVAVTGTDCPWVTPEIVERLFTWLAEPDCDAVIGPAQDGGYVLLGVKSWRPELFDGIAWGSGTVLAETRHRLSELGWKWRELAVSRDVDTAEDLAALSQIPELAHWSLRAGD